MLQSTVTLKAREKQVYKYLCQYCKKHKLSVLSEINNSLVQYATDSYMTTVYSNILTYIANNN